jgi:hypothetical protein
VPGENGTSWGSVSQSLTDLSAGFVSASSGTSEAVSVTPEWSLWSEMIYPPKVMSAVRLSANAVGIHFGSLLVAPLAFDSRNKLAQTAINYIYRILRT